MTNYKNIIFDLDGTLIDSQIDIRESFRSAIFKTKGLQIDCSSLIIGPPLGEMIKLYFNEISQEDVEEIVRTFRNIYNTCGFANTFYYDGIDSLLQLLKQQNKRIYIATNKPQYLTESIINKLNIPYFDDICNIDSKTGFILSKKEMISLLIDRNNLDYQLTIMIGDSSSDIKAAKENSIISIGVGYGYETKDQLLNAKPSYYFDTVIQLTEFLKIN